VAAAASYAGVRAPLRKGFLISWLAAILGFGVLADFGSELGVFANLEPGRFEVPFFSFARSRIAARSPVRSVVVQQIHCFVSPAKITTRWVLHKVSSVPFMAIPPCFFGLAHFLLKRRADSYPTHVLEQR
jgi:hypothetical protein